MNWSKVAIAGIAAGIVLTIVNYLSHGVLLADTYARYDAIAEPSPRIHFLLLAILIGLAAAILFAKTRRCWAEGAAGGAAFGFFFGLGAFFASFYSSLVIVGFPYFLDWCWGGINLIGSVAAGVVLGILYPKDAG